MSRPENQLRLNPETPFPGLSYYEEKDCNFFFGREAEKDELFRLVRRAPLTVLFGQSGLGKTSLIQAGLFPLLRDAHYLPIPIRIDFCAQAPALEQQVYLALENATALANAECEKLQAGESLWEYFHRVHIWSARNRLLIPALVFDQFEEIFTLGRNEPRTGIWLQALADLIENRIPQSLRLRIETGREAPDYAYDNLEIKVLLALREDFLPDLEDLRSLMPSLAANRMRLAALDGERALEVVQRPAPELFSPAVAEEIVRFVAGGEKQEGSEAELNRLQVEPSLLNLVCQQLNRRRIAEGVPAITADLLRGNKNRLLSDFYADCLHDLPQSLAVFVEEQLITPSGFRRSETLENALNMPGMEPDGLMKLVDRRLLRREERFGIPHLELIHDVLTATIRESRDRRRAEAEKEAERRREAELLIKLQRSRRHTLASVALVMVLLGGIALTYFGFVKLHYSYAKNYVKIYGVASPVDAVAFPYTAVEHRAMTYRFTSEGWFGKVLKMETIGADHQLVDGYLVTYLTDSDSEQTPLERVAGVEFVYDDVKDKVVSEIARNRFGRMVWGFLYVPLDDPDNNTQTSAKAMFLGPDGYPQPQRKSRAEYIEFTYNPQGYETRRLYKDREGKPAPGPDNAYGQDREYKEGRETRLTSLNSEKKPMNDLVGNAGLESIYDTDGNNIGWWAFDADKEPTLLKNGYYGGEAKYDRWGRETEKCYFNLRKEPVVNTSIGAHRIVKTYDYSGNVISTKLFGTANEPVISKNYFSFPAHEERKSYDPQNRNVQRSYFDAKAKGEPQADPDGVWHNVRYEYDEQGFLLAKSYFDKQDKRVNLTTSGIHRWEYVNDPFGMPIEERFFDAGGKPVALRKNGYYLRKNQYNKVGKLIEQSYFSVKDDPVVDLISGYHRFVQSLDRFGNIEAEEYFDEKDDPVDNKKGFHRYEASYDEFGSILSERWYDKNIKPCKGPEGAEHLKYSYNLLGKNTGYAYFDAEERPIVNKAGVHEILGKYNDKGLITRHQFIGLKNIPVEDVNGTHLALYDYDKRGRQTKETKLRADGSPNWNRKLGIATWAEAWDKENRLIKLAYFDENDRLLIGPEGYARGAFNYESDGGATVALYGIDGKPRLNSLWGWAMSKRDSQGNTTAYYGADGALINGPEGYAEVRRHWYKNGVLQDEAYFGADGHPVAGPDGYYRKQSLSADQPGKFRYFNTENLEIPLPGPDSFVPILYIARILDVTQVSARSGLQAGDILWRYGNWSFFDAWAAERQKGTPFSGISGTVYNAFLAERDRLRAETTVITVIRNGKMVNITMPPLGKENMGFEPGTRLLPIDTFKAWQAGTVEPKTGG